MKTQREIYEALLAGKTLKSAQFFVKLDDHGFQIFRTIEDPTWGRDSDGISFISNLDWSIVEEPMVIWACVFGGDRDPIITASKDKKIVEFAHKESTIPSKIMKFVEVQDD